MATEDQGIMSLPQGGQATAPQMPLTESYDAVKQGLQNASPQASAAVDQVMQNITPMLDQLSDDQLDAFLQMIQYLYEGGEQEYAKRLQEVISSGVLDKGDLPEEFDPEVLAAIGTVLLHAKQQREAGNQREQAVQPPAQFAKGGIAEAARIVASKGRSGDTMLAHINKKEAAMLKKHGGIGTINPATGLPEYGWNPFRDIKKAVSSVGRAISGVVKGVVSAVKSIVKSPLGKILATVALATFLGPGALGVTGLNLGAAALPIAAGTVTALGGGNLKQVLTSAATAYFAAPGGVVSNAVGAAGITNVAANAALSAGIVGTGAGLLTGQKLSDAVKSGLTAGAVSGLAAGVTQGFGTQMPQAGGAPTDMGPQQTQPSLSSDLDKYLAKVPPAGGGEYSEALANTPARETLTPGQVQGQIAQGGAGSNDPLGQFIQDKNLAGTQAPTPPRSIGESLSKIGGGIGDLVQGKEGAWDTVKSGVGDLFSPKTYTAADLQNSEVFKNARAAGASYETALKQASDAYNPSMLRSYGPTLAAGIGAAGMMGGFTPSQVPSSELGEKLKGTPGEDLIKANPRQYLVQGLPGVQYDQSGNIVGSTPWAPSATMEDVRVPATQQGEIGIGDFMRRQLDQQRGPQGGLGTLYTPAIGSLGQARQVAQPYNTAAMYGNLMNPLMTGYNRPYADGGLASLAQGGYPRRTGQISGPGTETSDSIPAMLSDGEFVMTAKAVRGAGNGSRRAGAKKMYALMHQLERNASRG